METVAIIACGAIARELAAVIGRAGWPHVRLVCLPPALHNRPGAIPERVRTAIRACREAGLRVFVAYGDCGTGGMLDRVLDEERAERLPGAHCYAFYAGEAVFDRLADEEPGTFYLTDFLARHFDRLVVEGLGIDRHPQLLRAYFGNYRRLVYLAQGADDDMEARARRAAETLGLRFERADTGLGPLAAAVRKGVSRAR